VVLSGVSPEGRYLLLIQTRGSLGRIDLQAPFPRRLEPFAQHKGEASLSPDGRSLVWHTSTEGLVVQSYASGSEAAKRFVGGPDMADSVTNPFFSADGRTIYALFKRNLVAFSLAPDLSLGEPKVLRPWTTTPRSGSTGGAASRDGRRLLLIETEEKDILDPQVVTDWTTLLPKKP
jgi:Tol biopolymer transport system component